MAEKREWIEDLQIEDAQIKWSFSNFDGREGPFNQEGTFFFNVILDEHMYHELKKQGWSGLRELEPREEGDDSEYLLKVHISYKFNPPKVFLIKGDRKFRADERDLADIRRDTTERIDVVIQPSRWARGDAEGISGYAKELYAVVKPSRFPAYDDIEEVR